MIYKPKSLLPDPAALFDAPDHDDQTTTMRESRAAGRQRHLSVVPAGNHARYLATEAAKAVPIVDLPAGADQEARDDHERNVWRQGLSLERRQALDKTIAERKAARHAQWNAEDAAARAAAGLAPRAGTAGMTEDEVDAILDAEHEAFRAELAALDAADVVPDASPPVPLLHGLYPAEDDRLPADQYKKLAARAAGMGITPEAFAGVVEEVWHLGATSDADVVEDDYWAGALHEDETERPAEFLREQSVETLLWLAAMPARDAAEAAEQAAREAEAANMAAADAAALAAEVGSLG